MKDPELPEIVSSIPTGQEASRARMETESYSVVSQCSVRFLILTLSRATGFWFIESIALKVNVIGVWLYKLNRPQIKTDRRKNFFIAFGHFDFNTNV
jgi:hypothetical protein